MSIEYWVMRIALHAGPAVAHQLSFPSMQEDIARGRFALHPDGHIMEPIEIFRTEEEAHEFRAKMLRDDPKVDYRVIINADCPV